jgi:S1-C subfamily serine protease
MLAFSLMPTNFGTYKSIVRLRNDSTIGGSGGLGSGVVFSPSGLILTNNHVVEDADFGTALGKISVEFLEHADRPPSNALPAEVIIRNEIYDLAVLKTDRSLPSDFIDLVSAPAIDASIMEQRIRILGYPPVGGSTITVTRGIASGFDEIQNLKTDAEINPGNSGGAALDENDLFLGVPSFIVGDAQGKIGFIITINRIREWFAEILKDAVPATSAELDQAFSSALIFTDDNVGRDCRYPRIVAKFTAVELLLAECEFAKVIPQIEFILDKRPRSALAYYYFGVALLGLGAYVDAISQFRICLAYNAHHIPALGNLGVTLAHLGRYLEALQIFEQIIDLTEDPAMRWTCYNNIGQIYAIWGKADLARSYEEKAFAVGAPPPNPLSQLAKTKGTRGSVGLLEAIARTEIAMEIEK